MNLFPPYHEFIQQKFDTEFAHSVKRTKRIAKNMTTVIFVFEHPENKLVSTWIFNHDKASCNNTITEYLPNKTDGGIKRKEETFAFSLEISDEETDWDEINFE